MKKMVFVLVGVTTILVSLLCSCGNNAPKSTITEEMAFEGVNNYCHSAYDWSIAEEKCVPSLNVKEKVGTINIFDYLKVEKPSI